MSYIIEIHGSKDVKNDEEGRKFEKSVATKAKKFVASISGVSAATLNGEHVGQIDLRRKGGN